MKTSSHFPRLPPQMPLDTILEMNINDNGAVSALYDLITGLSTPSVENTRQNWEDDLDHKFKDEEWKEVLSRINSSSICARHNLIQFKFVHYVFIGLRSD